MTSSCPGESRLSRRQRYLIALGAAGAASAYFGYRIYRSDSLAALLELRTRLRKGLEGASRSLLLASDCSSTVLEDLRDFLSSDSDEVPQSLRQLAKLAKSQDVAEATSLLAAAAIRGVRAGSKDLGSEQSATQSSNLVEQAVDALASPRGADLVTLAVSVACRTSIHALSEGRSNDPDVRQPSWWQQVIEAGCTPKGEKLYTACVGVFVKEGMKVYMGSMDGVNPWEDFFATMAKTDSQSLVDRVTRVFVNELVASYFKKAKHQHRGEARTVKGPSVKQQMLQASARSQSTHTLACEEQQSEVANAFPATQARDALAKRSGNDEVLEDVHLNQSSRNPSVYFTIAQQLMQPEVRGLLTVVVGTAAFEGVRSGILAARELVTGAPATATVLTRPAAVSSVCSAPVQQLTSRALGTLLLFIFAPAIIFLAGRRAALS